MADNFGKYCPYLNEESATTSKGIVYFKQDWFDAVGKMSHYKPNEGPPNCANWNPVTRYCDSPMSSGERWEDWENCAVACPAGYEYSLWKLPGGELFICLDRGGKIITTGSVEYPGKPAHWLDLLLDINNRPPVNYGVEIPVSFKFGELEE